MSSVRNVPSVQPDSQRPLTLPPSGSPPTTRRVRRWTNLPGLVETGDLSRLEAPGRDAVFCTLSGGRPLLEAPRGGRVRNPSSAREASPAGAEPTSAKWAGVGRRRGQLQRRRPVPGQVEGQLQRYGPVQGRVGVNFTRNGASRPRITAHRSGAVRFAELGPRGSGPSTCCRRGDHAPGRGDHGRLRTTRLRPASDEPNNQAPATSTRPLAAEPDRRLNPAADLRPRVGSGRRGHGGRPGLLLRESAAVRSPGFRVPGLSGCRR